MEGKRSTDHGEILIVANKFQAANKMDGMRILFPELLQLYLTLCNF